MINKHPDAEAPISVFGKAHKKFRDCQHGIQFVGQGECELFHYKFDTSHDVLNHCGSCFFNTDDPNFTKGAR